MSEELVVPGVGEIVDLDDENQCAKALVAIREFEQQVRDAKAALSLAIAERGRVLGTQTITLDDGRKAIIKGGVEITYDAAEVEDGLRALGCPEERIRQIVREEITYKVVAREAQRAAAANEEYAKVIEAAKMTIPKPAYISISNK